MLSCTTCLQKILANMSNFVSPFLSRLIYVCCSLSYLTADNQRKTQKAAEIDNLMDVTSLANRHPGTNPISQLDSKLALLRSTLATQIPLRLLAPILSQQSFALSDEGSGQTADTEFKMRLKYVEFYMQIARLANFYVNPQIHFPLRNGAILRLAVKQSNHEDLLANIKAIRSMFMNLFDLRTNMSARLRSSSKKMAKKLDGFLAHELGKYENFVVTAFCEFTFKLSEDLFRPIFFKLFEWSSVNNAPKDRLITFYRCTFKLSDKLKNLFVIFAPQFVQNAADLLNQLNSSKTG